MNATYAPQQYGYGYTPVPQNAPQTMMMQQPPQNTMMFPQQQQQYANTAMFPQQQQQQYANTMMFPQQQQQYANTMMFPQPQQQMMPLIVDSSIAPGAGSPSPEVMEMLKRQETREEKRSRCECLWMTCNTIFSCCLLCKICSEPPPA